MVLDKSPWAMETVLYIIQSPISPSLETIFGVEMVSYRSEIQTFKDLTHISAQEDSQDLLR